MKKNKRGAGLASFISAHRPQIINAASFIAAVLVVFWACAALQGSRFFSVKKVIIREKDDITENESAFAYFNGRNIFAVDLARESQRIALSFPSYRKIRLTRFLPDCIFVDFLRRTPVACIRAAKPLCVDDAAVLFELEKPAEPLGLPVIAGIERKLGQYRPGRICLLKELAVSLEVIRAAGQDKTLSRYRLGTIDVSTPASIVCFLYPREAVAAGDAALEVRLGAESVAAKLQILATVLTQMRGNAANIKYIDLRFNEPVIKFKNMEKK
ncbi:MAG: cell division protein FtsQ/DivIB [Deltaproteobacteria bacterium]